MDELERGKVMDRLEWEKIMDRLEELEIIEPAVRCAEETRQCICEQEALFRKKWGIETSFDKPLEDNVFSVDLELRGEGLLSLGVRGEAIYGQYKQQIDENHNAWRKIAERIKILQGIIQRRLPREKTAGNGHSVGLSYDELERYVRETDSKVFSWLFKRINRTYSEAKKVIDMRKNAFEKIAEEFPIIKEVGMKAEDIPLCRWPNLVKFSHRAKEMADEKLERAVEKENGDIQWAYRQCKQVVEYHKAREATEWAKLEGVLTPEQIQAARAMSLEQLRDERFELRVAGELTKAELPNKAPFGGR